MPMEDKDFVTIGSALPQCEDDEILSRKPVAVHDQVVRDEQGRIRFHGAFTGGFSAGYFNSVDTKEGWVPKHFKSSRSSRNQGNSSQKPEDFMDTEDFGEFGIAPKRLFTSNKYQGISKHGWKAPHENELFSLFSNPHLQQCIEPARITVGQKLLKRLGWRANNINMHDEPEDLENVFGCALPPNLITKNKAPIGIQSEVVCPIDFSIQKNHFGMGYKGLTPQTIKTEYIKNPVIKSKGIRGQAFGVGALEEDDDDIYAGDNASNYNTVLYMDEEEEPKISPIKKRIDKKEKKTIDGFRKASAIHLRSKIYQAPVIPNGFMINRNSVNKVATANNENESRPVNFKMKNRISKRGELLGENPQLESVFELISEKDRLRIEEAKGTYDLSKSGEVVNDLRNLNEQNKTYITDLRKEKETAPPFKDSKVDNESVTEWEKEQKRENSVKASHFSHGIMMGRFTKASKDDDDNTPFQEKEKSAKEKAVREKMFGQLTRDVVKWHPAKLLCVRFNVEDPYPDSVIVGLQTQKHSKLSIFDILTQNDLIIEEVQPIVPEQKTKTPETRPSTQSKPLAILATTDLRPQSSESLSINLIPADSPDIQEDKTKKLPTTSEPDEDIETVPPPNIDIFKAIFEDNDSDDDDESDEKDNETLQKIPTQDKEPSSCHQSQDEFAITLQDISSDNHNEECTFSNKKKHKREKHKHKKHKQSDKSKKRKKSKKAKCEKSDESSDECSSLLLKDDRYLLEKLKSVV